MKKKKKKEAAVYSSSAPPSPTHLSQLHCLNTLSPSVGVFSKNPPHFQICTICGNACNEYLDGTGCIYLCLTNP